VAKAPFQAKEAGKGGEKAGMRKGLNFIDRKKKRRSIFRGGGEQGEATMNSIKRRKQRGKHPAWEPHLKERKSGRGEEEGTNLGEGETHQIIFPRR